MTRDAGTCRVNTPGSCVRFLFYQDLRKRVWSSGRRRGDVSRTDTGYLKAVPAAANTVTSYRVEGGRRFVEPFFRRRVRLCCDGEPATAASAGTLKELVPEARQSGESCGTCSQDLGLLKRTETQLSANSCFWLWLIRHAGWVDSRFRVETHGATPCQDAYDSAYTSQILPFGELEPTPYPFASHQTPEPKQNDLRG